MEQEFETPGDALLHYGVKGMRWGVRDTIESASTSVSNTSAKTSKSISKASKATSQGISNASKATTQATKNAATKTANAPKQGVQNLKDKREAKKKAKGPEDPNALKSQLKREGKSAAWGTRQAYIEKTLDDAIRLDKIAKGNAGIDQKAFATKDLVFTKAQARRFGPTLARHAERIQKGEAKTGDIMLASVRLRRRDLTIGMDLSNKKNKAAEKRGRTANFDIPRNKSPKKAKVAA